MRRLTNPVRHYAWGSSTHLPKLCGLPQTGEPVAEMWLGAHPADPSRLDDGRTLDDAIRESPESMLGPAVRQSFGDRLPFLMKLLAAAEPLSLQVHPTGERARIRFAEQDAAGIPLAAPERSYQDDSHKPELLYALTRFEGMAGFRDPAKTAVILRRLRLPWLDEVAERIESTQTPFQTLRSVVTELLAAEGPELTDRLQELRASALVAEAESHVPPVRKRRPAVEPSSVQRESTRVYAATVPLIDRYPEDAGVLVTLLLNHVVLAAGEAMFIDAGVIHAYTSGFGVEIMAASDNVLRAGLTPKHVDIPELLEITNFTPMPPPLWAATDLGDGTGIALRPPVDEFELRMYHVAEAPAVLQTPAPQIVLCLSGSVSLTGGAGSATLGQGDSAFVDHAQGTVTLTGSGRVAVGRTPIAGT